MTISDLTGDKSLAAPAFTHIHYTNAMHLNRKKTKITATKSEKCPILKVWGFEGTPNPLVFKSTEKEIKSK